MQINVHITVAKPAKVVTYANVKTKTVKLKDKPRKERKKYLKSVRRNFCITTKDEIPTLRSTVVTDVPRKRKPEKPEKKEKKKKIPLALVEGDPYTEPEFTEPEFTEPEFNEPEYTEPEFTEPEFTEPEDETQKTEAELLEEKIRREEELEDERIFQGTRYRYVVPHNSICSAMFSDTDINLSEISEEGGGSADSQESPDSPESEPMSDASLESTDSITDKDYHKPKPKLRSSMRQRSTVTELDQLELIQFDQIRKDRKRKRSFGEGSIHSIGEEDEDGQRMMTVSRSRRMSLSEVSIGEEEPDDLEEPEEKEPPVMMQYFLFLMFWAFFTNLFAKFKFPFGGSQKQIKPVAGSSGRRKSISSRDSSLEEEPSPPMTPPSRKTSVTGRRRRVSWVDERDCSKISEEHLSVESGNG